MKEYIKKLLREFNTKVLTENIYEVYHGTNEKFKKFDFNKTANGVVWFTNSIDSIKNQTHGGDGSKYILACKIKISNPAGWNEYEKYSIDELINMKYDGVILPEDDKIDFIVFHPNQILDIKYTL